MAIAVKIKYDDIDPQHLFAGAKHRYLDLVLIESKDNRYGDDYMVVQGVSKAQRDAGVRGKILGNAKILGGGKTAGDPGSGASAAPAAPQQPPVAEDLSDDIPF